ncbi:MAG: hypothetical protein ACRETM_03775 [Stenotrophobium sp.]
MRRYTVRICLLLCLLMVGQGAFAAALDVPCCATSTMMPDCQMPAPGHSTAKNCCTHSGSCVCPMAQMQFAPLQVAALLVDTNTVVATSSITPRLRTRGSAPPLRPPINRSA